MQRARQVVAEREAQKAEQKAEQKAARIAAKKAARKAADLSSGSDSDHHVSDTSDDEYIHYEVSSESDSEDSSADEEAAVAEFDAEREREQAQPGYYSDRTDDDEDMRQRKDTRRYIRDVCDAGIKQKFIKQVAKAYLKETTPEEQAKWLELANEDVSEEEIEVKTKGGKKLKVCCMRL